MVFGVVVLGCVKVCQVVLGVFVWCLVVLGGVWQCQLSGRVW